MSRKDEVFDLDELVEVEVVSPEIKVRPAVVAPVPPVVEAPRSMPASDVAEVIEHAEKYFGTEIKDLTPLQQLVLVGYLRTGNASLACAMAGASVFMHRKWLKENTLYSEIFTATHDALGDKLEQTALVEALSTRDPKLLMGLLKGFKRDKYGTVRQEKDDGKQAASWAELASKITDEE